jgi:hypothetical protein
MHRAKTPNAAKERALRPRSLGVGNVPMARGFGWI